MTGHSYPTSLDDIPRWSRANAASTFQASVRFAEYVVLKCLGADPITKRGMVLKGGNALRFAFQSPRSTKDLDFTIDGEEIPDDSERLRSVLSKALRFAERRFGIKAKCQSVERRPMQSPGSTHPTYSVSVAYQFPTDRYFHNFEEVKRISTIIPLEISFKDVICEAYPWDGEESVRVCSLEDILAEKLRALLQQRVRNRERYQDVYDIAKYVKQKPSLDRAKIGDYLLRKAVARGIEVRKSAFDEEIREKAQREYDNRINNQAPHDFIPFDVAWKEVLSLVATLDIPA